MEHDKDSATEKTAKDCEMDVDDTGGKLTVGTTPRVKTETKVGHGKEKQVCVSVLIVCRNKSCYLGLLVSTL